jgi:hypothetical protein
MFSLRPFQIIMRCLWLKFGLMFIHRDICTNRNCQILGRAGRRVDNFMQKGSFMHDCTIYRSSGRSIIESELWGRRRRSRSGLLENTSPRIEVMKLFDAPTATGARTLQMIAKSRRTFADVSWTDEEKCPQKIGRLPWLRIAKFFDSELPDVWQTLESSSRDITHCSIYSSLNRVFDSKSSLYIHQCHIYRHWGGSKFVNHFFEYRNSHEFWIEICEAGNEV